METQKNEGMTSYEDGVTVIFMGTDRLGDEFNWNIERETGYKPLTKLYQGFALADAFGPDGVISFCKGAFAEGMKNKDIKFLTELSMVLNHRGWMHHHAKREAYSKTYFGLWQGLVDFIYDHFTGDDLSYFIEVTD